MCFLYLTLIFFFDTGWKILMKFYGQLVYLDIYTSELYLLSKPPLLYFASICLSFPNWLVLTAIFAIEMGGTTR